MDWKEYYKSRVVTAEEALSQIQDGEMVMPSHAAAEPKYLTYKMVEMKDRFHNVGILQGLNIGDAPYAAEDCYKHFVINSFFYGANNRKCLQEGRGETIPIHFYAQPVAMRQHAVPVDVGLIQVTPPDEDGYVNMGTSCDQTAEIVKLARITIAQVNKNMPHLCGQTKIKVTDIDYFVEYDEDIYELPFITSDDPVSEKIGYHISTLIEDGACLQMGQGKVPNAILKFLEHKKDLGIHTEVFSDNLLPLIEKGVVNGQNKNIDKGKITAMFIQGSHDLYKFVDRNPMINIAPGWYTNNPAIISQNDKVCAINACIEIDLTGQVNCEWMNGKIFSGIGGQVDFLRGAAYSKGGKPILCLPSTARHGAVSRIVPTLAPGTPVSTPRCDVHWVVTEFGAVNLFGKSLLQRGDALIEIAHPDFRDQLQNDWDEIWRKMGSK